MKLRSCHIDNFGKLSDLHLEFQDGVNLFHEPNAWGKSTLAAFLRVMFYGFDSKRESGLFDKERVVFRPWQGGTYGGELDFSYQGKEYSDEIEWNYHGECNREAEFFEFKKEHGS